jgi:hypothetical protein
VTLTRRAPRTVPAGSQVTVAGRIASALPGADPLGGLALELAVRTRPAGVAALDRARAGAEGRFRLRTRLARSGELVLMTPRFRGLSPLRRPLGRVRVRPSLSLAAGRAAGAG